MKLDTIRIHATFETEKDENEYRKELAKIRIPHSSYILSKDIYIFQGCINKSEKKDISFSISFVFDNNVFVREVIKNIHNFFNEFDDLRDFQITLEYK